MKKLLILLICIFLASCGTNSNLEQAKKDLLNGTSESTTQEKNQTEKETLSESENIVQTNSESSGVKITESENMLLKFEDFSLDDINAGEIEIRGIADSSVEKITVLFQNSDSDFPDDSYTLKTYSGDGGKFRYVASSKNQVLDFGKNEYEFRAYTGKEYESSFVMIDLPEESQESQIEQKGSESALIGTEENILSINLPTSSKYGEPVMLGEASFTYSQIKGLEVNKQIITDLNCESVTDYLKENLGGWFYWNTCRDIVKDEGISFNVVRLEGDEYIYERHYANFKHGLYGTIELERGEGVDSETIAEKNSELKENEYEIGEVVDGLMRDIVKS